MNNEQKLTILQHLNELRSRLIICVVALVITTIITLIFTNQLFNLLIQRAPAGFKPIYTEMTEMFVTYIKVAVFAGAALSMPVFLYQLVRFVAPALTSKEKRYFYALLPGTVLSFAAGVVFGYIVLIPPAVQYLLTFSGVAEPFIKIGNYISFVTTLLFAAGVIFETPLVIFFLAKIRVVSAKQLARYRKFAFLGVFVIGAIVTPTPDPFNQTLVAVPLYLLFELGILLARFA